jgi:hypothetical protein
LFSFSLLFSLSFSLLIFAIAPLDGRMRAAC